MHSKQGSAFLEGSCSCARSAQVAGELPVLGNIFLGTTEVPVLAPCVRDSSCWALDPSSACRLLFPFVVATDGTTHLLLTPQTLFYKWELRHYMVGEQGLA